MRRIISSLRVLAALAALATSVLLFRGPIEQQWLTQLAPEIFRAPAGFMAEISSEPSGAEIVIDGVRRGDTPFLGNVPCRAEDPVRIEIRAPGWDTWRREIGCREGQSLEVRARLER